MTKIIIEVGSTNTKIDLYNEEKVTRLEEISIYFKKNYKEQGMLLTSDVDTLINKILELKKKYDTFYICGTSIFRELTSDERQTFLDDFYMRTGFIFHILSPEEENKLTVLGATRFVSNKVGVFVGGGGSTEISIFDKEIIGYISNSFGVMDIMQVFPDLASDFATTSLSEVMEYIEEKIKVPDVQADILILAGGGHESFVRGAKLEHEKNTLYEDTNAPIIMDIETRTKETNRFFESISMEEIKSRVSNPDWWYGTRAMAATALVVAKKLGAKYIVPTNISMVYGLLENK